MKILNSEILREFLKIVRKKLSNIPFKKYTLTTNLPITGQNQTKNLQQLKKY